MAAILIAGALAIADKVEAKKEAKRQKKLDTEKRYQDLQQETRLRLEKSASIGEGRRSSIDGATSPPTYDEAVAQRQRHNSATGRSCGR